MDIELPRRYVLDPVTPVLGEGGMGRVLKARDVILDVPVALKVVRPDLAADERFRKLFDLEVRVAARFTHPHIVPLHDLGTLGDGTPFLGLALADAGSFGTLRHEALPWPEIARLMSEMLDALTHLHARGVLHRDLKPENVLLYTGPDGKRHVWLADLGLANASSQLAKKKGRVEGTPGFMAPEQKLGLPREYGPWTDLFSVGVILWELVTGHLPFEHGRSPLDAELPPLVPREGVIVPEGLDLVLANLLAGEPLSRYDLVADVRTELLALPAATLDGEAGRARGAPRPTGGTVAPSVPPVASNPPSTLNSASSDAGPGAFDDQRTMFDMSDEAPRPAASFVATVPLWNRPKPGPLPLQPIPEIGSAASARASLPLFALRELPIVARDAFRRVVWDMARAVIRDGKSRVVLVIGETGSGKTKLVESVARTLEEGGWAESIFLSWQQSSTNDDGYAGAARGLLRPWNETRQSLEARLRRRLGRERGGLDAAVQEEVALLTRWCGLSDNDEAPVPAGLGLREVYRTLEAHSWRGLSLLVLDDAQWADEEGDGLAIAQSVLQSAQEGKEKRLLVLATVRSEDLAQDQALAQQVEQLVQLGARRLDLPRLDRRGTETLLREMLTLVPELAKKVAQRCEGNPLFARQLLLEWANRGWLVDTGDLQFGLAQGVDPDAVLPADAAALFRDRIAALAEASGQPTQFLDAVHSAALAGQLIPADVLETIAGPELYTFLRGSGLWVEKEDNLRFDHGLLHQAVKNQAEARVDLIKINRRLAAAFLTYGTATGEDTAFQVARHAHAGRDWRNAVNHGLKAAETAWNKGRSKEVELASDLAIDACKKGKGLEDRYGWTVLWRARALEARGIAAEAGEEYKRAHDLFNERNDDQGLTEALIGLGWHARQGGDMAESERCYQDAMRRAKARKDLRVEAAVISGLAWCEQQKRNFEGADILFTRVSNRYAQLGDRRGVAEAALGQAFVARRKGAYEEAEELYADAMAGFQEGEDLLGVARAKYGLAVVRRQQLRLEEGEKLLREANATAEELGATDLLMETRFGLAEIYRLRGERERAQKILEAQARWAARQNLLEPAIFAHLGMSHLALLADDLQTMYEQAVAASEHLNKVPGHWLWAQYRLVVATLLALRGDEDQTYRWLWSAADLGLADTVDHDNAYYLTIICHVAHTRKWVNVMKVASKLAISQWDRLRLPEQAKSVGALQQEVLHGASPPG